MRTQFNEKLREELEANSPANVSAEIGRIIAKTGKSVTDLYDELYLEHYGLTDGKYKKLLTALEIMSVKYGIK